MALSVEDQTWLKHIQQIVEDHLTAPSLSVAFVATELGVSESTLWRQLKRITGLTPLAYVRFVRLQKAKSLIISGQYPNVEAVAKAVGFKNVDYFSQRYEALYKVRPSALLKEME